jgi:hypothetical protein
MVSLITAVAVVITVAPGKRRIFGGVLKDHLLNLSRFIIIYQTLYTHDKL